MSLLVSTNWCAHANGRANNPKSSKYMYSSQYLESVWYEHIVRQIDHLNLQVFLYRSNCEVAPSLAWTPKVQSLKNQAKVETQRHCHDVYAGNTLAAQYALVNGMDWLFIEQDCLVWNLKRVFEIASKLDKVWFGGGEWAYQNGWVEESLMFVPNSMLSVYIERINRLRLWDSKEIPEPILYKEFQDVGAIWPFGYGRVRPINFNDDVFYAQQLSDDELDEFVKRLDL